MGVNALSTTLSFRCLEPDVCKLKALVFRMQRLRSLEQGHLEQGRVKQEW